KLRQLPWHIEYELDRVKESANMLRLDAESVAILQAVRMRNYESDRHGAGAALLKNWRGKNNGRLLRIALVIEMLTWVKAGGKPPTVMSGTSVRMALTYLEYAEAMLMHCLAELAKTEVERDAARVAQLILEECLETVNE